MTSQRSPAAVMSVDMMALADDVNYVVGNVFWCNCNSQECCKLMQQWVSMWECVIQASLLPGCTDHLDIRTAGIM